MASPSPSPESNTDIAAQLPLTFTVNLTRGDFIYYNWTAEFNKPVLPFLLYTFVFFNLSSLLGVFPAGNLFAFAALVPLVGYVILIQVSASLVWRRVPQLVAPRHYSLKQKSYRLKTSNGQDDVANVSIDYADVAKVLVSRRGYYLLRSDGSADIIPKAVLEEHNINPEAFSAWLDATTNAVTSSFFL